MKKILHMTRDESALLLKFMLCTLLGTLVSWALGDPYSVTITITAILVLWNDRGYRGGLRYGVRRVLAQAIQGVLVLVLIFPCKYFQLPVPDVVLIIVASCFALCIGLPINYKHQFAPFHCTLANATLIVACATVREFEALPRRVLQCIIGFAIGYFINWVIFPMRNRVLEIQTRVRSSAQAMISSGDCSVFRKAAPVIEKEMGFLLEDRKWNLRQLQVDEDTVCSLQSHRNMLTALSSYLNLYQSSRDSLASDFSSLAEEYFSRISALHLSLVQNFDAVPPEVCTAEAPAFPLRSTTEIRVAGHLLDYAHQVNTLAALLEKNPCAEQH